MLYRITFWICFIGASIICALTFLVKGYGNDFMKLVLMSFGAGFVIAIIVSTIMRFTLHIIQWVANVNDYRVKHQLRKDS